MKNVKKGILFLMLVLMTSLSLIACGSTKMSNKQKNKEKKRIAAYLKNKYPGRSFSIEVKTGYVTVTDEDGNEKKQMADIRTATDKNGITFTLKEVRTKKSLNYTDNYIELYNQHFYKETIQDYVNECMDKYGSFSGFTNAIPKEDEIILENANKLFESDDEAIEWYASVNPLEFIFRTYTADASPYAANKILSELQNVKKNTKFQEVWIKYDNQKEKNHFVTIIAQDYSAEEVEEELKAILKNL